MRKDCHATSDSNLNADSYHPCTRRVNRHRYEQNDDAIIDSYPFSAKVLEVGIRQITEDLQRSLPLRLKELHSFHIGSHPTISIRNPFKPDIQSIETIFQKKGFNSPGEIR